MRKRILPWLIAISLTVGSLMPPTPVFAAQDEQEITDISSMDLVSEDDPVTNDLQDEDSAGTGDTVIEEPDPKAEDDPAKTDVPEDAAGETETKEEIGQETGSEENEAEQTAPEQTEEKEETDEVLLQEDPEAVPAATLEDAAQEELLSDEITSEDITSDTVILKLRSVDLMYGESADNADGHLDRLFAPVVSDKDTAYELKTAESLKDSLTFTTSYKFITDSSAFDIENEAFAELADADKVEAFKEIATTDLAKADAGSRLFVAAMAITSDGKVAFAVSEFTVSKRPVAIEFPATEELSVSADSIPEDGLITVASDSEIFLDVAVIPAYEYTVSEADAEKTVKGAEGDKIIVPDAASFIPSGVTVDVTGLDLTVPGYQPADAAYELNSELFGNYTVTGQDTWPVYVVVSEELVSMQLMGTTPIDGKVPPIPKDPDIEKNEIGFISNSEGLPRVAVKSTHLHIDVEIYLSKNAKRTGAVLVDTVHIDNSYASYMDDAEYLMANSCYLDGAMFVSGTYYLFGRFYNGEGKKGYVESEKNITFDANYGQAPKVLEIVNATGRDDGDGSVTIENPKSCHKAISVNQYGTNETIALVGPDEEDHSKFVIKNLHPGHYVAYFVGYDVLFADSLAFDSGPVDFYIGEKEAVPSEMALVNRATGEQLSDVTLKKGETLSIVAFCEMSNSNTVRDNAEVTFVSSNPKAVSVDTIGNVKALKADETATITATTVAKNKDGETLSASVTVNTTNEPLLKIKTAKFAKSTYNFTIKNMGQSEELEILLDSGLDCPITWYTDNYESIHFVQTSYKISADGEGKAVIQLQLMNAGKTVVTANIGGVKTISCTVMVNGSGNVSKPYFYGGKFLTGFWGFKHDAESDIWVPVASGFGSLKKGAEVIRYYDPYTYLPAAPGVLNVNKKLYLVQADGFIAIGVTKKSMVADDNGLYYVINTSGEIQTGWQKPDLHDTEFYFDPGTGAGAKETWVPKGKGYTWVNSDGLMLDDSGESLNINGVHVVDGDTYCFKGGLVQTGFVYFDETGAIINAKDVAKKPKDTCYASYFSPADGRLKKPSDTNHLKDLCFGVGGKTYFVLPDGRILLGTTFNFIDAYENIYYFHSDYTGALFSNQLFTFNGKTYYADAEGILARDKCVTIGGKVYHFNNLGEMDCIDEGVASELYYNENGIFRPVYVKASNSKKPTAGTFFYKDPECKQKITNNTLSEKVGDSYLSVYYVSKQGSLFSGLLKIGSSAFFFDPDTCRISTADNDHIVTYKGKKYACNKNGVIIFALNEIVSCDLEKYNGTSYITTDKNGVLLTGLRTIQNNKYIFDTNGVLVKPDINGFVAENRSAKRYLVNPSYVSDKPYTWYVYASGKFMLHPGGGHIIAKDGSEVMSGWATVDGEKYYVYAGYVIVDKALYKIGGKYYSFGNDGRMLTGWQRIDYVDVLDLTNNISLGYYEGEFYFYFNEKTGVMVTGWQNMPAPMISAGKIRIGNILPTKKKIYFNTDNTKDLPAGALVSNRDMTVGGKLYRFDADGSVKSGQEGMVYSDPTTKDYNGLDGYLKADGTMARGRTLVKLANTKAYFYFNLDDGKKAIDVLRKTGKSWFYYGINGDQSMSGVFTEAFIGKQVIAIYNKDGSIKQFVRMDGSNEKLKNCWITSKISNELYYLGNDGLPKTGPVAEPETGIKAMIEADGRNLVMYSDSDYKVVKFGNKIYLTRKGMIVDKNFATRSKMSIGPDGLIVLPTNREMFDGLPAADQAAIDKMYEYHDACYSKQPIILVLNQDGTVHSGKANIEGVNITANKYGLVNETISAFVNDGGWKLSPAKWSAFKGNGELVVDGIDLKAAVSDSEDKGEIQVRINLDQNYNVTFTDLTGKPLTGDYAIDAESGLGDFMISVKNGKLTTGKKTYTYDGVKMVFDVDRTYGISLFPDIVGK